jgi:RimJ/RimL family protein N-acetyltransferase
MTCMNPDWWPLAHLRLRTPRLELRLPSEADLEALGDLAALGVHDPLIQPFTFPWTDVSPADRARSTLQYQWSQWGQWRPERWSLELAVFYKGEAVGVQGISATDFSILRQVGTGSWLGLEHHGQGIGTEMRAAALYLAFEGLGAGDAVSAAFTDNAASIRVSRKLGYVDDGIERHISRGRPAVLQRLRLDRATWEANQQVPVTVHGLGRCLPMFGVGDGGILSAPGGGLTAAAGSSADRTHRVPTASACAAGRSAECRGRYPGRD